MIRAASHMPGYDISHVAMNEAAIFLLAPPFKLISAPSVFAQRFLRALSALSPRSPFLHYFPNYSISIWNPHKIHINPCKIYLPHRSGSERAAIKSA
jgi:hypothetical protein